MTITAQDAKDVTALALSDAETAKSDFDALVSAFNTAIAAYNADNTNVIKQLALKTAYADLLAGFTINGAPADADGEAGLATDAENIALAVVTTYNAYLAEQGDLQAAIDAAQTADDNAGTALTAAQTADTNAGTALTAAQTVSDARDDLNNDLADAQAAVVTRDGLIDDETTAQAAVDAAQANVDARAELVAAVDAAEAVIDGINYMVDANSAHVLSGEDGDEIFFFNGTQNITNFGEGDYVYVGDAVANINYAGGNATIAVGAGVVVTLTGVTSGLTNVDGLIG